MEDQRPESVCLSHAAKDAQRMRLRLSCVYVAYTAQCSLFIFHRQSPSSPETSKMTESSPACLQFRLPCFLNSQTSNAYHSRDDPRALCVSSCFSLGWTRISTRGYGSTARRNSLTISCKACTKYFGCSTQPSTSAKKASNRPVSTRSTHASIGRMSLSQVQRLSGLTRGNSPTYLIV